MTTCGIYTFQILFHHHIIMFPIYLIENAKEPSSSRQAIDEELQNNPSNHLFHDTHSVMVGGESWTVTELTVKEAKLLEDSTNLQEARKREGVLDCGLGPTLNDGKARIVFAVSRRDQFQYFTYNDKNVLWGVRCLQVRDSFVPLRYTFSNPLLDKYRTLNPSTLSSTEEQLNEEVPLRLESYYKAPLLFSNLPPSRIITPGKRVPDFMELKLCQNDGSLCEYRKGLLVSKIKVVVEEHTLCKVQSKEGFSFEKKVEDFMGHELLKNFTVSSDAFKSNGTSYTALISTDHYPFVFPRTGPSFYTEDFSRTYTVRIEMTICCNLKKIPWHLSTRMNVDVAIEHHLSSSKPAFQPQLNDRVLLIDKIPRSPQTLLDVASTSAMRVSSIPSGCLSSSTVSIPRDDHIVALTTMNLPRWHDARYITFGSKRFKMSGDYALVMKEKGWSLVEYKNDKYIDTGHFLNLEDYTWFFQPYRYPYGCTRAGATLWLYLDYPYRVFSGSALEKYFTVKVDLKGKHKMGIHRFEMKLVQQKIHVLPGGTHEVKHKSWRLSPNCTTLSLWKGTTQVKYLCNVPKVEASVLSNTLYIGYRIYFTLTLKEEYYYHKLTNYMTFHVAEGGRSTIAVSPPPYRED